MSKGKPRSDAYRDCGRKFIEEASKYMFADALKVLGHERQGPHAYCYVRDQMCAAVKHPSPTI
eukprot:11039890-Alexandrium_andersonii.AAC.1